MTKMENKLAQKTWLQNWSGAWGLPFTSLYGRLYSLELKKFSGKSFRNNVVIFENGICSNFIPADELAELCNHYAELITKDNSVAERWSEEIFKQTDLTTEFLAEVDKRKEYTLDNYHFIENALYKHVPPNFAIKKVIDYLPSEVTEKYLETFSKVRVYTEHIYPEADRLLRRIAQALFLELSREEVSVITREDMEIYTSQGVAPVQNTLSARLSGVGFLYDEVSHAIEFNGADFKTLLSTITSHSDTEQIKGTIAYKGVARGRVRIVFDPKEAPDFQEGDVLVTGMTRPEFLSLMQKSAAFVTDSGGLLSHAAIVARELKKPCIVGTNIATKALKDGDLVEVDANVGIVRKI